MEFLNSSIMKYSTLFVSLLQLHVLAQLANTNVPSPRPKSSPVQKVIRPIPNSRVTHFKSVAIPRDKSGLVTKNGFRPFSIVENASKGNSSKSLKRRNLNAATNDALFIGSIVAPIVIAGSLSPLGFLISGITSMVLFFKNQDGGVINPNQIYSQIFGKIQQQIDSSLNAQLQSNMVASINDVSIKVNHTMSNYLSSSLGLGSDTKDSLNRMLGNPKSLPIVPATDVDFFMGQVHTLFDGNTDWFETPPQGSNPSPYFLLANPANIAPNFCLHTQGASAIEGTEVLLDFQCDYEAYSDKVWAIDATNGNRLVFISETGSQFCLAYNSPDGKDLRSALAIFSLSSTQCQSGSVISLQQNSDASWSIFDGTNMICQGDGARGDYPPDMNNWDYSSPPPTNFGSPKSKLVTTEAYVQKEDVPDCDEDMCGVTPNTPITGTHSCSNNGDLRFLTRVPIIMNGVNLPGGTLRPPLSLSQIAIQSYLFPSLASTHLIALKEQALYGTDSGSRLATFNFNDKVVMYADWIDTYLPVFIGFSTVRNLATQKAIEQLQLFRKALGDANLDGPSPP